jgi:hypothetical protein
MTAPCGHFTAHPLASPLGFGAAALEYAALGFAVLPLARKDKPPHGMLGEKSGVHHATSDPALIIERARTDPAANIGVRCGQLPFPGTQVVIIDTDTKGLHDGPASLAAFLAHNGLDLPPGPACRTPSAGGHLWMAWPREWGRCPTRKGILGGVDVLGDDAYAVVPPSMREYWPQGWDGEPVRYPLLIGYEWVSGCPGCALPQAPPWLPWWLHTAPPTGKPGNGSGGLARDRVDVAGIIAHGAEVGTRNDTLMALACSLFRTLGSDSPEVPGLVYDAWRAGDQRKMPAREVDRTIRSAREFIAREETRDRKAADQYIAWLNRRRPA